MDCSGLSIPLQIAAHEYAAKKLELQRCVEDAVAGSASGKKLVEGSFDIIDKTLNQALDYVRSAKEAGGLTFVRDEADDEDMCSLSASGASGTSDDTEADSDSSGGGASGTSDDEEDDEEEKEEEEQEEEDEEEEEDKGAKRRLISGGEKPKAEFVPAQAEKAASREGASEDKPVDSGKGEDAMKQPEKQSEGGASVDEAKDVSVGKIVQGNSNEKKEDDDDDDDDDEESEEEDDDESGEGEESEDEEDEEDEGDEESEEDKQQGSAAGANKKRKGDAAVAPACKQAKVAE